MADSFKLCSMCFIQKCEADLEVLNGFGSNIAVNAWKMVNFSVKNVQVAMIMTRDGNPTYFLDGFGCLRKTSQILTISFVCVCLPVLRPLRIIFVI